MASPPETSICAASAAHASRKLTETTAAPKIAIAATGSGCRPASRTTNAGAMNAAVISADRIRVRQRAGGVTDTGAANFSAAIMPRPLPRPLPRP